MKFFIKRVKKIIKNIFFKITNFNSADLRKNVDLALKHMFHDDFYCEKKLSAKMPPQFVPRNIWSIESRAISNNLDIEVNEILKINSIRIKILSKRLNHMGKFNQYDELYETNNPYVLRENIKWDLESRVALMMIGNAPIIGNDCCISTTIFDHNKPYLVLDLDNTLVYTSKVPIKTQDFKFKSSIDFNEQMIYVSIRPYCKRFLKKMSKHYNLILFTASVNMYARSILYKIDVETHIRIILTRIDCATYKRKTIKDLRILGIPLNRTILLDDKSQSMALQPQNGVLIKSYFGNKDDNELRNLAIKLIKLSKKKDLRDINKKYKIFEYQ